MCVKGWDHSEWVGYISLLGGRRIGRLLIVTFLLSRKKKTLTRQLPTQQLGVCSQPTSLLILSNITTKHPQSAQSTKSSSFLLLTLTTHIHISNKVMLKMSSHSHQQKSATHNQYYLITNVHSPSTTKEKEIDLRAASWKLPYSIDDSDLTFDGKPLNMLYEENKYKVEHERVSSRDEKRGRTKRRT